MDLETEGTNTPSEVSQPAPEYSVAKRSGLETFQGLWPLVLGGNVQRN